MYGARCGQMRALGGDCFTFLPLPGYHLALAVADASGKGLPAALLIANVQSSLRTAALFAPDDLAAVVTAVNRELQACSPADRYASLFYSVFDEDTRTLHYVERRSQSRHGHPLRRRNHLARSLCATRGILCRNGL